jgi:hypothetical protein
MDICDRYTNMIQNAADISVWQTDYEVGFKMGQKAIALR